MLHTAQAFNFECEQYHWLALLCLGSRSGPQAQAQTHSAAVQHQCHAAAAQVTPAEQLPAAWGVCLCHPSKSAACSQLDCTAAAMHRYTTPPGLAKRPAAAQEVHPATCMESVAGGAPRARRAGALGRLASSCCAEQACQEAVQHVLQYTGTTVTDSSKRNRGPTVRRLAWLQRRQSVRFQRRTLYMYVGFSSARCASIPRQSPGKGAGQPRV